VHAHTQQKNGRRPNGIPTRPATSEDLHAALEVVAEAIDLPLAATDDEIRDEILAQRADHAAYAIQTILKNMDDAEIVRGAIVTLKQRNSSPRLSYAGQYITWDEVHGENEELHAVGWRRRARRVLEVVRAAS
jgi:hypothetical protein